jgi:hypothetical protein
MSPLWRVGVGAGLHARQLLSGSIRTAPELLEMAGAESRLT